MNRLQRPALLALAALLVAAGVFHFTSLQHEVEATEEGGEGAEFAARQEWEFRRLRDPATNTIPADIIRKERAFAATLPVRADGALFKGASAAAYEWEWRGPYNIGGRTRALAYDITGEDTLLAAGTTGGIWRSTNGGSSWERATKLNQLPNITCLVQDTRPGKSQTWYCGTGEYLGGSASTWGSFYIGDGMFKSTDNGRSWSSLTRTASRTPQLFDAVFDVVNDVAFDRSDTGAGKVYAAVYGAIEQTTNGGTTWREVLRGSASQYTGRYTDVAVTTTGVAYATFSSDAANEGIWRSTNGQNWTKISPPFWPDSVHRVVIGIAPSNENSVYFLAETPLSGFKGTDFRKREYWTSFWKYTYLSGDGTGAGGVWEDRTANLPAYGKDRGDFIHQQSYDLHVHVKPDDENFVVIGGTNLYKSSDGFATTGNTAWIGGYRDAPIDSAVVSYYSYPDHHPDQHTAIFSQNNPLVMYSGSDGGVHKTLDISADSVHWVDLNRGYATTQFYTVAIDHATTGDMKVVGGLQDNGTWGNMKGSGNLVWDNYGSGDGSYCSVVDGGGEIFVSKQEGKTYRVVLNPDRTMQSWARIDPVGAKDYQFINPFVTDPNDQKIVYMPAGKSLWRNSDVTAIPMESMQPTSVNWSRLDNARDTDSSEILAIGVSTAAPSHRLYFGCDSGRVYRMDNAHEGDPVGIAVTGTNFPKGGYVSCIAVDPLDGDQAIVVFSNYGVVSLFLTTDAGVSWTPIAGNLEQYVNGTGNGPSCRWAEILHRPNGTLYLVGTSTGLYSSYHLDGMKTQWQLEGAGTMGNVVVDMIDVRQTDGFVAIATHANGVFSTTIPTVGVESNEVAEAARFQLEQNFPNPVHDRTTINFVLSAASHARLTVHDVAGREIETLLDERLPSGRHSITFNTRHSNGRLPAGTYYYRLEADGSVLARSMQIVN
jgi:photosystem II stability/assembly factor-like uncharacterized protein